MGLIGPSALDSWLLRSGFSQFSESPKLKIADMTVLIKEQEKKETLKDIL